jgi:hypothetical protein
MAAESLTATLTLTWSDVQGTLRSAAYPMSFGSQTRLNAPREFTINSNSTVDLWDPTLWTGYPEGAFTFMAFAIQDIGVAQASASITPIEIEQTCNLASAQGFIDTIPAGGWFVIPGNASYRTPANQNDQFTSSTAGLINRVRVRNKSASVNVKLTMYLADATAP